MMPRPSHQKAPHFHLLGVPITLDIWMALGVYFVYTASGGGRAGVFAAVAIVIFTLIHEMGHALTARRFGAEVAVTLAFLGGWAAYTSPRPLERWQRNVISAAGPAVQIVAGIITLGIVRASFPDSAVMTTRLGTTPQGVLFFDLHWSIGFASIGLGALNFLPVWPLDGGHIVDTLLERFGPAMHRLFLWWSAAAAAAMILAYLATQDSASGPRLWASRTFSLATIESFPTAVGHLLVAGFVFGAASMWIGVFCGMNTAMRLQSPMGASPRTWIRTGNDSRKQVNATSIEAELLVAERRGWDTGVPGAFPRGYGPSPWLEAELIRRAGGDRDAIGAKLSHLSRPGGKWISYRLDRPEIGTLLYLVPPQASICRRALEARVFHGSVEDLTSVAMELHRRDDSAEPFYLVAEGLAVRGQLDESMNWLTSAVERSPDPMRLSRSKEFRVLHGRTDFQQLLGAAERAAR